MAQMHSLETCQGQMLSGTSCLLQVSHLHLVDEQVFWVLQVPSALSFLVNETDSEHVSHSLLISASTPHERDGRWTAQDSQQLFPLWPTQSLLLLLNWLPHF